MARISLIIEDVTNEDGTTGVRWHTVNEGLPEDPESPAPDSLIIAASIAADLRNGSILHRAALFSAMQGIEETKAKEKPVQGS